MIGSGEVVVRLASAALLGAVVGLERERLEWAAGLRTHMLVCVGSALVMIVSMFGFAEVQGDPHISFDPSRVAAQVVSGIGFLGAGTILFLRQEVIRGLTTAASLWTIAAVGLAVGGGLYVAAVATTVCALVILALVKPLELRLFRRQHSRQMTVVVDHRSTSLAQIEAVVEKIGANVAQLTLMRGEDGNHDSIHFSFVRSVPKAQLLDMMGELREVEGVREVRI
jgi:putative Mg2+ transporter-C (MgtC) family protein